MKVSKLQWIVDTLTSTWQPKIALISQPLRLLQLPTFSISILQGADPDGDDPEGNKLMDTVKDEAIKTMLKNA